jgi:hypothetical protein
VSDTPALAVVGSAGPDRWPAALESAVRAEFLGSPLIPPTGSPLLAKCGVEGLLSPGAADCVGRRRHPALRNAWLAMGEGGPTTQGRVAVGPAARLAVGGDVGAAGCSPTAHGSAWFSIRSPTWRTFQIRTAGCSVRRRFATASLGS